MLRGDGTHVLLVAIFLVHGVTSQTGPTGCTYSDGVYTCTYDTMSSSDKPIDFTQFSETPQQLVVENSGFFPTFGDSRAFSTQFSTSSGITLTQLNENFPASLTLDCGWGGSAYISSGAFYDMEYVENLKVKNCDILYIGTDTFDAFVQLDVFSIQGGSIDQIEVDAFSGLSVQKSPTLRNIPRYHGKVDIRDTEFVSGVVPTTFLSYFDSVSTVIIRNAAVSSLSRTMFTNNQGVTIIDLSDNTFTLLPQGFLSNFDGLSEMTLYNIAWECTCDNTWWVDTVQTGHILVKFDGMCSNINGMSVYKYYHENCAVTAVCEGITGVAMGDKCVTVLSIVVMVLSVLSCPATVVALILAIMNLKDLPETDEDEVEDIDENIDKVEPAKNNLNKNGPARPAIKQPANRSYPKPVIPRK